jgi:hypothetical protein
MSLNGGQVFSYDLIVEPQTKQAFSVARSFELNEVGLSQGGTPQLESPVGVTLQLLRTTVNGVRLLKAACESTVSQSLSRRRAAVCLKPRAAKGSKCAGKSLRTFES